MTRNTQCVLQVSNNHFVAGGSDRYYFELSDALRRSGFDVLNFAANDERNVATECAGWFPDAPIIEDARPGDLLRYLYSPAARNGMSRLLDENTVDVAHLHIYYGRLTASILKALHERAVPVVQTLHEYKLICAVYTCMRDGHTCESCHGRQFWKAAVHRCNRGSVARSLASAVESYTSKALGSHDLVDHFITVSDFQRGRILENRICEPSRVTTVHNFVDPERLPAELSPGRYLAYFGRLERLKGIDTLLAAMRRLPQVHLKIIGDGSYRAVCEAADRDMDNVEYAGFLSGDELFDAIRGAFATVIPSEWYENCPMSVLESLAMAKPVIGTAIGGIPELISDQEDGFVVPAGDAAALAEAIGRLAGDKSLAREFGAAGRRKIETRFSPAAHVSRIRRVYGQLAA